jgi:hypothetical protein
VKARRLALRVYAEIRLTLLAIWRGVVGVYRSNDLTFASSIAYYALLSLFPFFLLLLSVIGSVTSNPNDRAAILDFVLRYFPRQFEFVTTQLTSMQDARVQLGVSGSLLMIWASMGVFGAITSAVNHAWGVDKTPSYLKHKLISFTMLVAASLLLLAGLLLVSAVNVIRPAPFRRALGEHGRLHRRRRVDLLLRAQRDSAVPRRVGGRGRHGTAVARRAARILLVRQGPLALQPHSRIDCRGRGLPDLDLHFGGPAAVRR